MTCHGPTTLGRTPSSIVPAHHGYEKGRPRVTPPFDSRGMSSPTTIPRGLPATPRCEGGGGTRSAHRYCAAKAAEQTMTLHGPHTARSPVGVQHVGNTRGQARLADGACAPRAVLVGLGCRVPVLRGWSVTTPCVVAGSKWNGTKGRARRHRSCKREAMRTRDETDADKKAM